LTTEQVQAGSQQIVRGEPRPKERAPVAAHPFDHPHYWAPFVLIGDAS
jgi:CHAT domain-containing protein